VIDKLQKTNTDIFRGVLKSR